MYISSIYEEVTPKKINDESERRPSLEPEITEPEVDIHKLFAILECHFRKKDQTNKQNELKNSFAALGGSDSTPIELSKLADLFTSFNLEVNVTDLAARCDTSILNSQKVNFTQFSQMFSD